MGFWRALASVWAEPERTVRQVARGDAARFVIAVAWLSGILDVLQSLASRASLEPHWGPFALVLAFGMGPLLSFGYYWLAGALVGTSGRLLGGGGDSSDTRVALACGTLVELVALPFWIPVLAVYGLVIFTEEHSGTPYGLLAFGIQQAVLWVWAWVVRIRCLAEVHGFSRGRAVLAVVLPWLTVIVVLFGVALVAVTLMPDQAP